MRPPSAWRSDGCRFIANKKGAVHVEVHRTFFGAVHKLTASGGPIFRCTTKDRGERRGKGPAARRRKLRILRFGLWAKSSVAPLLLLSPPNPLRWALAGPLLLDPPDLICGLRLPCRRIGFYEFPPRGLPSGAHWYSARILTRGRHATSSQAPYPSFWPLGQKLSRSATPPFPTKPASLGFGGVPNFCFRPLRAYCGACLA